MNDERTGKNDSGLIASGAEISKTPGGTTPRALLLGYNGANNTGSEARLLSIIEDVRAVLGPRALITVPTLNEPNLRRYLKETSTLEVAPIPSIFFFAIKRLVRQHDLVMLVEGSCYMDTWTNALLWAFLSATKYAHDAGKSSIAYAVDAGGLSQANRRRVCREGSKTDLIALRTQAAAERLRSCGVTAPIIVTGDTAFTFRTNPGDEGLMTRIWPEASSGVVGFAVVDFNIWPVVIRLWGAKGRRYRWPYYFSSSRERRRKTEDLAKGYAAEADRVVERWGRSIALIAMEALPDEPLATRVKNLMKHHDKARVFSSDRYNASQMTSILRSLDLLITSRYHAGVLSLGANVPQIAIAHDYRLRDFYADIGLKEEYLIEHDSPDLWQRLSDRVDRLMADPEPMRRFLRSKHEEQVSRAKMNRSVLRSFLKERGWKVID